MEPRNPLFILLYVPNLIGYIRIILLGLSFFHLLNDHQLGIALYSVSYALDALDGLAARLLNQSSLFGSLLDMLTDRVSSMCLLMTLGLIYQKFFFLFMFLLSLDIVSHWLHSYSALLKGKSSHKVPDVKTNFLIRIYYGSKFTLTLVCFMEQLCYLSLVALFYETADERSNIILALLYLSTPVTLFKNIVNLLQINEATKVVLQMENTRSHEA